MRKLLVWAFLLILVVVNAKASTTLDKIAEGKTAAFGPWTITKKELLEAVTWGKNLQRRGKSVVDLQGYWRLTLDRNGEYIIVVTPEERAAELGFKAAEESLPDSIVEKRLEELLDTFNSGIYIYVMLRSYPHESRAFGSAGRMRPATPSEVFDARFLLDAGSRKFPGISLDNNPYPVDPENTHVNIHGLKYLKKELPDIKSGYERPGFFENARFSGSWDCYAADYPIWWSFVDEEDKPAFGSEPKSLTLTVITPSRKREVKINLSKIGLP